MKKLVLLFTLIVSCATFAGAEPTRQDIQVSDVSTPIRQEQIRSVFHYTDAWINYATRTLEVNINDAIGVVEAVITDAAGTVIAKVSIDTDAMPYASLSVPAKGTYRLTISGGEYLGIGDFTVE